MGAVKTYRLVLSTDVPSPSDGPIALGSLLIDPNKPESPLDKND